MRKKKPNDCRSRSFTAANIHISERKPPAAPRKSAHARPEPSSGTLNFSPAAAILASCASLIRANFPPLANPPITPRPGGPGWPKLRISSVQRAPKFGVALPRTRQRTASCSLGSILAHGGGGFWASLFLKPFVSLLCVRVLALLYSTDLTLIGIVIFL